MSYRYESPKNSKKTNPMEYNDNENVKERHHLGKYFPDKNSIGYKNSKYIPEFDYFEFSHKSNNASNNIDNKNNFNNNIGNINNFNDKEFNKGNRLRFAIKSTII